MITHDGALIVSREYGYFIRTENILCIKGGFKLEGLSCLKHFELYYKGSMKSIMFQPNSITKIELFRALSLYGKTYKTTSPFLVFLNGHVINLKEISTLSFRGYPESKGYVVFNNGLEVDLDLNVYTAILDALVDAVKLDNAKYNKVEIPGFMDTRRRK